MTNSGATDFDPSFNAAGDTIVFASDRNDGNLEIFTLPVTTPNGTPTRLTTSGGIDRNPIYTPDGHIVFETERDGNLEIYIMDGNGQNPKNLTNNTGPDQQPYISPDGSKIVWAAGRGGLNNDNEIFIMNADGSNQTRLTVDPGNDIFPSFRRNP